MEQHITLDNTYMNVIKFGRGSRTLSIIAGVSLSGLEGLGSALEEAYKIFGDEFTVYVFDRKKLLDEGYTMAQMAEDIYRCLKSFGVTSTSVYGTSQGGMIGQLLALSHPELVEKLVLCSTTCKVTPETAAVFAQWRAAAHSGNVQSLNSLFLDYVYSQAFKESIKDSIPVLINQGTAEDCRRFEILLDSMKDFDISTQISKISCPALVIADKNDRVIGSENGQFLSEKLNAQQLLYEKYSHAVYDEAPDLKEKIYNFLKG